MSPQATPRPQPNRLAAACKEIRRMLRTLTRFLDSLASITIVCLALYIGAATFGLGA